METIKHTPKKHMRALLTLLMTLFASTFTWAQYIVIMAKPYEAGEVRVGTEMELGTYNAGSQVGIAEPGETVYFDFNPYSNYRFTGITYDENLSSENVTQHSNGIYSFTMPDGVMMMTITINFEKIPEIVSGVNINETNFPDNHFREWLLSQSYGKDAVITDAEMSGITKITARGCNIQDLSGIENFKQLTNLDVGNNVDTPEEKRNRITSLDLSGNPKLRELSCDYNQLVSLNVSQCPELRKMDCSNNLLTALDVTNNENLLLLYCNDNQLPELIVASNPNLGVLSCSGNRLTALDVTNNLVLEQLFCENNQLTAIDVTNHHKMMMFNCNDNQLTSLDLTGCDELFQLYIYNNKIKDQAMENLVNSLPSPPNGGYMVVIDLNNAAEQNAITDEQITVAKEKGWSVEGISGDDFVRLGNNDEHEYVDLGLTSGTLWATCNVGAFSPQESGLYFAWGDTTGHDFDTSDGYLFNWENYKWGEVSGFDTSFTKYCSDSSRGKDGFTDGKYELDPEDDAAYVNWGNQWRTPSKEQLDELRNECEWTKTTVWGVNGYEVKGANGNTIFLPETGWRLDDMLLDGGAYWSRTSDPEDVGGAYYLGFDDYGWYEYGGRCDGQCVRPVFNKDAVAKLLGDVNGDKIVDVTDVMLMVNHIIGNPLDVFISENADINDDQVVDVTDVMLTVNIILNGGTSN